MSLTMPRIIIMIIIQIAYKKYEEKSTYLFDLCFELFQLKISECIYNVNDINFLCWN